MIVWRLCLKSSLNHPFEGLEIIARTGTIAFDLPGKFSGTFRDINGTHRHLQKTTRWLVGMFLAYGVAISGMLGRAVGLY
jgi:hypothetical protein